MSNELKDSLDILEKIDYNKIIDSILTQLDFRPISISPDKVIKNIPEVSYLVAKSLGELDLKNIVNVDTGRTVTSTLNFLDDKKTNQSIERLYSKLNEVLDSYPIEPTMLKSNHNSRHYDGRVKKVFGKYEGVNAGIEYEFKNLQGVVCEMDYLNGDTKANTLLREDIVKFSYDNKNIEKEIKNSLVKYYTRNVTDTNELHSITRKLDNHELLVDKVVSFITTLRCGYLKRAIQGPVYMDFIREILARFEISFSKEELSTFKEFCNYANRFSMLETLVNEILFTNKNLFQVDYDGTTIDLLHKLRMEDVYSFLPVVGIISDPLSTVRDSAREKGVEVYGLSLKRNGKVATEGVNSFEYNMNLLNKIVSPNPNSKSTPEDDQLFLDPNKKYKLGQELIRALLLEFFLINLDDDSFDPCEILKSRIVSYNDNTSLSNRKKIIKALDDILINLNSNFAKIEKTLSNFKELLAKYINYSKENYSKTITKKLSVLNLILPKDLDSLGGAELNSSIINPLTTHLVKYTTLLDRDLPEKHCVYSYEYEITLTSKGVVSKENKSSLSLDYNTNPYRYLNFAFIPRDLKNPKVIEDVKLVRDRLDYETSNILKRQNLDNDKSPTLFIEYMNTGLSDHKLRYIYDTAFTILSTLVVNILCNKASDYLLSLKEDESSINRNISDKLLYTTVMQYTSNNKYGKKDEFTSAQTVVREIRKSLEQSLSDRYTSRSQGFEINGLYKTSNALASMYSRIARKCTLPSSLNVLDKTAIITVTSSCVDRAYFKDKKSEKTVLIGEVVLVKGLKGSNNVTITNYKSFSQFLDKEDLHSKPRVLKDIANELKELGYKHILYIAKTPYTSNILEQKDKTEMYFMNESVLNEMSSCGDISIYPLYINELRVQHDERNVNQCENSFIYVSSCRGMLDDIDYEFEGIVPLIKIFTPSSAHTDSNTALNSDNFYSKIITYSSIKGIYSDEIRNSMNNSEILVNKPLQSDISNILLALHAVRNSKIPNRGNTLAIKDNPYEDLFGDKSVSKISNHTYMINGEFSSSKKFNTSRLGLVSYLTKAFNNSLDIKK